MGRHWKSPSRSLLQSLFSWSWRTVSPYNLCMCMHDVYGASFQSSTYMFFSALPLADTFKVSHLFLLNQDLLNLILNGSSSNRPPLSLSLASQRGGMGTFILSSATVAWGLELREWRLRWRAWSWFFWATGKYGNGHSSQS